MSALSAQKFSLAAWRFGVPLLAIFLLLIVYFAQLNVAIFLIINHAATLLGDGFWSHITILGDATLGLLVLLFLVGRKPQLVWQLLLASLLLTLATHGFKAIFSTLRPPAVLAGESFHLIGQSLQNNAFPSGHTASIFLLAGVLCNQLLQGYARYLMLGLAILVGLSRIACGVHWPVDVLGGALIGWSGALAGMSLGQSYARVAQQLIFQRVIALLLSAIAVWTLFFYDNNFAGTASLQRLLAAGVLITSLPIQYRLWKR